MAFGKNNCFPAAALRQRPPWRADEKLSRMFRAERGIAAVVVL
jgi:hypothetical protein